LVAVDLREGQLARDRAGRDEDVRRGDDLADLRVDLGRRGGQLLLHLRVVDLDTAGLASLAGRDDLRVADDVVDLVLLEEELDALVQLARDVARAADDLVPLDLDALEVESPEVGLLDLLEELGVGEEGLARDAPPVEADAAEPGALDAGDLHAQLGGADRADVAGGPAADDDQVVVLAGGVSHARSSFLGERERGIGTKGRDCSGRALASCQQKPLKWPDKS